MGSETKGISVSVAEEQNGWNRPSSASLPPTNRSILVSQFINTDPATRELELETGADHYRISITLRGSKVLAHYNGHQAFDGRTTSGMVHIAEPSTKLSAEIRSPGEALHIFLPRDILARLGEDIKQPQLELRRTIFRVDPSMGFLAQAIANSLQGADELNRLYVDSLCTAAVVRLMSRFSNSESSTVVSSHGLSAWRLKRVREFIDAHLEDDISLQNLADIAGLSQMHFASQFRQACGSRPHEYLVQQRIERAKDLLLNTRSSLLEIALAVGFGSHSHFTNTFRRLTGGSPAEWRKLRTVR